VQELKESEKKLKIVSLLHVISASRGKISLRDLLAANENNEADGENTDIASFVDALSLCDDVAISDAELLHLSLLPVMSGLKCKERLAVTCARLNYFATKLCTMTSARLTSHT
jgi:hypothetical protein